MESAFSCLFFPSLIARSCIASPAFSVLQTYWDTSERNAASGRTKKLTRDTNAANMAHSCRCKRILLPTVQVHQVTSRMTVNLLTLDSSTTELLLMGLGQLAKIHNVLTQHYSLYSQHWFNCRWIPHFSHQMWSPSKSCSFHIRLFLDSTTAVTTASSIVFFKSTTVCF